MLSRLHLQAIHLEQALLLVLVLLIMIRITHISLGEHMTEHEEAVAR
jgi:hypothetical protein